jgi:hypothetical protein
LAEFEETGSVKACVELLPPESVTFAVKAKEPLREVIPLITPVEDCNWIPEGKDPAERLH